MSMTLTSPKHSGASSLAISAPGAQPGLPGTGQCSPAPAPLCAQQPGQACLVVAIEAEGRLGQRLADMGFCPGLRVFVVRRAPLGDPLEIDLAGIRVCVRAAEAAEISVRPLAEGRTGVRP